MNEIIKTILELSIYSIIIVAICLLAFQEGQFDGMKTICKDDLLVQNHLTMQIECVNNETFQRLNKNKEVEYTLNLGDYKFGS